jgi:hypothetical protein
MTAREEAMAAKTGLVTNLKGLRENLKTLHRFARGNAAEKSFHHDRTRLGRNFLAMKLNGDWVFSPSKFSGYPRNGLDHLAKLHVRDGRRTDRRIDSLIAVRIRRGDREHPSLEGKYRHYCAQYDIDPTAHRRTFWRLDKAR